MLYQTVYSLGRFLSRQATVLILLLGIGGLAAACSNEAPGSRLPFDVGNMAFPEPLPQGVVSQTAVAGTALEAGNMAYPAPLPQGNLGTTRLP